MRICTEFTVFAVCLLAILLFYYWPFLARHNNFYTLDIGGLHEPYARYVSNAIRLGRLPLWNPYVQLGISQMAVYSPSALHPIDFLFVVMDFSQAYSIQLILNQLLAGIGTYLLVSSAGWGLGAAALAGFSFALSGLLFSLQAVVPWMATLAACPLATWVFLRLAHEDCVHRQCGYAVAGSILVAILLTSAPDLGAVMVLILCVCSIFIWVSTPKDVRPKTRALCLSMLSVAAGVLLSLPQLLPLFEWCQHSTRQGGLDPSESLLWSASWYDLLGIVLPQPFGDRTDMSNQLTFAIGDNVGVSPLIASAFMGPVLLSLAVIGFSDRSWRIRWILLFASVASAVLALGSNFPLIPQVLDMEHLKLTFRFPVKLIVFPVFVITIASARGFKSCSSLKVSTVIALALSWLLLGITMLVLLANPARFSVAQWYSDVVHINNASLATIALTRIAWSGLRMSCLGLITCAACYMLRRKMMQRAVFLIGVTGTATCLLMWVAFSTLRHVGPRDLYSKPIAVSEDLHQAAGRYESGHPIRLLNLIMSPVVPAGFTEDKQDTINSYCYRRQILEPMTNIDAGIACSLPFKNTGITLEHDYIVNQACLAYYRGIDQPFARYCQMTATSFVMQDINELNGEGSITKLNPKLNKLYFELIKENSALNYRIYRVLNVLPRARFARRVEWGKPHTAVMKYVSGFDANGFNPEQLTVLEHGRAGEKGPKLAPAVNLGTAQIVVDQPEQIGISANTPNSNFLVLADTYYPGWKATIDGHETEIFEADSLMRAVLVPAGRHTVRFVYRPASFLAGLLLAALGLVIILVLLCFASKYSKSTEHGAVKENSKCGPDEG